MAVLTRRCQQRVRNRSMLEAMLAVNDLGESFQLSELSDVNVSNPKVRRAELMVRIRGFEEYAKAAGHKALFITVTLPSRFHCMRQKSGIGNPRFDGSTVQAGQTYLRKQWARMRSHAQRTGLAFYGFRIAEPHHDGTPHWHLLLFTDAEHIEQLHNTLRRYFDPEEEAEPGSAEARVNLVSIDPEKGSAAGYVAKYVAKNIDGFRVGEDAESAEGITDATETASRVDAWASTHGIRQFQQIGGPPVSIWRELRRVTTPCAGVLEEARLAVEDQDWRRYCEILGGVHCAGRDRPLRLHTAKSAKPGAYGDPILAQIKGVKAGDVIVLTRLRSWRFLRPSESGSPWTRVNNCTQAAESTADGPPERPGVMVYAGRTRPERSITGAG